MSLRVSALFFPCLSAPISVRPLKAGVSSQEQMQQRGQLEREEKEDFSEGRDSSSFAWNGGETNRPNSSSYGRNESPGGYKSPRRYFFNDQKNRRTAVKNKNKKEDDESDSGENSRSSCSPRRRRRGSPVYVL